jgi:hypothetical protein
LIKRIIYGPPDWLVQKFDSRDRRAFGFWILLFSAIGAVFWGWEVLYVSVISVLALIPNFTSETPVEKEEGR